MVYIIMKSSLGQTGILAGLVSSLATAATVVAGVFAIENITKLVQVIVGNLFYVLIISIVFIGGLGFLYMVRHGRLTREGALGGFVILLVLGLSAPVVGIQLSEISESWQADVTVSTSEPVNGNLAFDNLEVSNVQEVPTNKLFIQEREACLLGVACEDWTVQLDFDCDSMEKIVSVSGKGGESVTKTVSDLPPGDQCQVQAEMVRPQNHDGISMPTRSFVTG
jgi:hypothetical protein